MVTVPAGTTLLVRMLDTVDSSKNAVGSRFTATLETNLVVGDTVIGAKRQYGLRPALGSQAGGPRYRLFRTSTRTHRNCCGSGTAYPLMTSDYQVKGSGSGKRSAKRILGGAGLGAAIGGIAGNAGKEQRSVQQLAPSVPWRRRANPSTCPARRCSSSVCSSQHLFQHDSLSALDHHSAM